MAMRFQELDDATRKFMLAEFEAEEAGGSPYRGELLTNAGKSAFPDLMRRAIVDGNEVSLARALEVNGYWAETYSYERQGKPVTARVNVRQASERLATTEFSTWYTRGLAKRLMSEGVNECEVYRAAEPKWVVAGCSEHEGRIVSVRTVYDGHRARYWGRRDPNAFSVPFGPGCHHSIRRV